MRSPQEFHKYECFLYDCIDPIHLFYDTLDPKNAEVFSVKNKTQHILTIITKVLIYGVTIDQVLHTCALTRDQFNSGRYTCQTISSNIYF